MTEAPPGSTAPPERIELPGGPALVRVDPERAARAAAAINESLEHLRPWMAWAQEPATEEALTKHFAEAAKAWSTNADFSFSVVDAEDRSVLGGAGLHRRGGPDELEIGYWVHVDHAGRGLATAVARALTDAAFALERIELVRITCEADNVRSARVPAKLGFTHVGTWSPDTGVCADRLTQHWEVSRQEWRSAARP